MMTTWAQVIYIFFPIPIFCLALLSIPLPPKIDRFGTLLVSAIFFTPVRVGPLPLKLLYIFLAASLFVFGTAFQALQSADLSYKRAKYDGETMWYGKAMKFRLERNFWLSLFNAFLWLLVWRVLQLKLRIMDLKGQMDELQNSASAAVAVASAASHAASSSSTKKTMDEQQMRKTIKTTNSQKSKKHNQGIELQQVPTQQDTKKKA